MTHFCTYFDHRYLPRGLALYSSLMQHCKNSRLWVLCLSRACYEALTTLNLPNLFPIALGDLEAVDRELLAARQNRSLIEYYFTCTPSLPLFILKHYPEVDRITYVDADLYFFSDPKAIFDEVSEKSIAIVAHRFPEHLPHEKLYGTYNVGILSFRRDSNGLDCLEWWRARCIEWCYDRVEGARFADQKYLDEWPTRFREVLALTHKGVNVAPWNLANDEIAFDGRGVLVGGQPLIVFHFHGLKRKCGWVYDPGVVAYGAKITSTVRKRIYVPYIHALVEASKRVAAIDRDGLPVDDIRPSTMTCVEPPGALRRIESSLNDMRIICSCLAKQKYIWIRNGWPR